MSAALAAMVTVVVAAPQVVDAATAIEPLTALHIAVMLVISALPGSHVVVTVLRAPARARLQLPPWLISKTAAGTMACPTLTAVPEAWPIGLLLAVPLAAVAAASALGTLNARQGHAAGALPVIASFAAIGCPCLRAHLPAAAITVFCVAAIAALLGGFRPVRRSSAPPPRSRRTRDR